MKLLLRIVGGLAVLVVLLLVVGLFLPRTYRVERSLFIAAPAPVVFAQVADLRAWRAWGVWFERDPQMEVTYSENPAALGGWSAWRSATQGNGRATLVELAPPTAAGYQLEFEGWEGMASTGRFSLLEAPGGVSVTWSDAGDLGGSPVNRWFGLFLERWIGPDFEAGLARLKRLCEAPPPPASG